MEPCFNFNNKVMGKVVGNYADNNNLIPKEQYRSRKQHQARNQGVNKRLLYDLNQMQQRPLIVISNDAKSCYDWIIHSIASLAMHRLGLPLQPIKCMLSTIQQMENHIRTAFGDLDVTMDGSD